MGLTSSDVDIIMKSARNKVGELSERKKVSQEPRSEIKALREPGGRL